MLLSLKTSTLTAGFEKKMHSETLVASYIVGEEFLPEIMKICRKKKSLLAYLQFVEMPAMLTLYIKIKVQTSSKDLNISSLSFLLLLLIFLDECFCLSC